MSVDGLSPLLERFRVQTRLFHAGPLCGVTTFGAQPNRSFLHILRHGEMDVTYASPGGRPKRVRLEEPTLIFYPRPLDHAFHNAPIEDSDFACATIEFQAGHHHPLVRGLPPVVLLPLDAVDTLKPALELLFAEIDHVRGGNRVLVDRMFEIVLIHLYRWLLEHGVEFGLPAGLLAGLSDDRLAPSLSAVHESPGRPWNLQNMAHEATMSRSSFAAHFKQTVGQSPMEYVTNWRISLAQERLREGAPVGRTARELGYDSPASFSRVFAQRVGRSPRAWLSDVE
jgi:AraC-like DNA-binding protein